MTSNPVTKQPAGAGELYPYHSPWNQLLCGPFFKTCPKGAFACFCLPCFVGQLSDRVGDHFCTCCAHPCALGAIRTKVRTAYKIDGSLIGDCCLTSCCTGPCAAVQIDNELTHRGVPAKRAK